MLIESDGGEGEIRTPDTVARMPHFECGAFNHSATSPAGAVRAPYVDKRSQWSKPFTSRPEKSAAVQGRRSGVPEVWLDHRMRRRARFAARTPPGMTGFGA